MSKCKVTVLRRTFNKDLAEQYCSHPEKCPMFKDGEVFLLDSTLKPPGFCDGAWAGIFLYVFAFIHGGRAFFKNWMKDENTMIACCNDGIRPVILKIEKID